MQVLRAHDQRGHANFGWLKTWHSFSFGRYVDRNHMGFSSLRVINEDYVAPDMGFDTHPHDNMEIMTVVLSGALEHKDSMGSGSIIRPGDVQLMSAGSGVTHSEFNPSKDEETHLLQIWIIPNVRDGEPNYQQKHFADEDCKNKLGLIAAPESSPQNNALKIKQDAYVYKGLLDKNTRFSKNIDKERYYWLHLAKGDIAVNDQALTSGDGLAITHRELLEIEAREDSMILLFDLPSVETSL
jgi:redox-sensitive bicupin YhaK (pirin superfamily)